MVSRLVLGCGTVGQRIVESVAGGDSSVRVVTLDGERVEALRGENIRAEHADPTDPAVLRGAGPADVVLVVESDPDRALRIARRAREAFPDATIVTYLPLGAGAEDRAALSAVADRVVDARANFAAGVTDLVSSPAGLRTRRLRSTLHSIDGTLAVVAHDNPDPDAIGAAVALVRLAEALGVDAVACYYGAINHQENRALVNLLDLELRKLDADEDLDGFGGFALVDHSRPGVNDQLPPDLPVDIVVDHHPPREPVEARFVDLRSQAGATSTLLVDYLRRFGVPECGGRRVATALLYGIRVDTDDFSREVSEADFEAAAALTPHADGDVLERVESPAVSPETLDTFGRAARNREVRDGVLAANAGRVLDRDAIAQAAERLLDLEGVSTALAYGYDDATVYLSARARGAAIDLGETLRIAFDDLGSAGGHVDMAGAQLPLEAVLAVAEEAEGGPVPEDPEAGPEDPGVEDVPRGPAAGPPEGLSGNRTARGVDRGDDRAAPAAAGATDPGGDDVPPGDRPVEPRTGTNGTGPDGEAGPAPADGADAEGVDDADAESVRERVRSVVSETFFETVRNRPRDRPEETDLPEAALDADYVPAIWDIDEDG